MHIDVTTDPPTKRVYLFTGVFLQYEQGILLSSDAFVDQSRQVGVLQGGSDSLFVI